MTERTEIAAGQWFVLNKAAIGGGIVHKGERNQACLALQRKGMLTYDPQPQTAGGPPAPAWRMTAAGWAAYQRSRAGAIRPQSR